MRKFSLVDELNRFKNISSMSFNTEKLAALLESYVNELELFNSAYDLVGAVNRDEIISRHILDSLTAVPVLSNLFAGDSCGGVSLEVADVGSGGGLPGLPLAAVFPEVRFTLIERMSKRCAFLENCAAVLGLKNVSVLQSEAEKVPEQGFDAAVFRAFRPLDEAIFKALYRLVRTSGFLAAYKAKSAKIREEMNCLSHLGLDWKQYPLDSSFLGNGSEEHERNLVVIQVKR